MNDLYNDFKNTILKKDILMRIILINIIIHVVVLLFGAFCLLLQISNPLDSFIRDYLMLPSNLRKLAFTPWTIFTYMFLHSGIFHLLFNMLVLYWFGSLLKEYLGKQKFIYTYFLSGIFGGLFFVFCYNAFPYFNNTVENAKALGASAAVMGVVFASATLLPNYSIVLAIFGPIKLKYIAFIYLLMDLAGIGSANTGGHLAHLGGAIFGFLIIKQLQRGNDWTKFPSKIIDNISGLFKPKKLKVAYKNTNIKNTNYSTASQAEVDQVLDKISKSGYEKLSAKEKEILFNASK